MNYRQIHETSMSFFDLDKLSTRR